MNEEINIIAVVSNGYDFTSTDGKHMQGTSRKVVVAYYKGGAQIPYSVDVLKTTQAEYEKALKYIGKRTRGVVLYDKYGRFAGIGSGT